MESQPFFSVIIPAYNRAHIIDRAIRSVLGQNFKNFELIVVDDGSDDHTAEKVKNFEDERVKYFYQSNAGVSSARNTGAKMASGEYLIFLDSDDSVGVNWLYEFYLKIKEENSQHYFVIVSGVRVISERRNIDKLIYSNASNLLNNCLSGTYVVSKVTFFNINGFDERLKFSENSELFIRIMQSGEKIIHITDVNLFYFESEAGGSKDLKNKIDSLKIILRKHSSYLDVKRIKSYNQIIGVSYLRLNQLKKSRPYFKKAIKLDIMDWKNYLRFAISYLPFLARINYGVYKR